jgi:hypothetical protein
VEREQAARRRLEAAEAELSQMEGTPAEGTTPVEADGVNGNGHEDDPRTTAILQAYLDAGGSSVKAAELLRGTEWETSDRTIRTVVKQHPAKLEELKAA